MSICFTCVTSRAAAPLPRLMSFVVTGSRRGSCRSVNSVSDCTHRHTVAKNNFDSGHRALDLVVTMSELAVLAGIRSICVLFFRRLLPLSRQTDLERGRVHNSSPGSSRLAAFLQTGQCSSAVAAEEILKTKRTRSTGGENDVTESRFD